MEGEMAYFERKRIFALSGLTTNKGYSVKIHYRVQ